MLADQRLGCSPHACEIERGGHVPYDMTKERARQRPVPDRIAVGLGFREDARVPPLRHFLDRANADVAGLQPRIERALQVLARDLVIDRDARHLRGRVHAGVRSPCGIERIVDADDGGDFVFEDLLDRDRVGLPLPSRVIRAVVRNRELECPHSELTMEDCAIP